MKADFIKYQLDFKFPAGTSRGVMRKRDVWFLKITNNGIEGIGEVAPLPGLSSESNLEVESTLKHLASLLNGSQTLQTDEVREALQLKNYPSIIFGLETALQDLALNGRRIIFENTFTSGNYRIPINGLIWMGTTTFLKEQIDAKVKEGYKCIKLKIGSLDFEKELSVIEYLRSKYPEEIIVRVDANGAFSLEEVYEKLELLRPLRIHSIEQPLAKGHKEALQKLCKDTPVPIALDEELIGVNDFKEKQELLNFIKPQYIILKPSLLGGFASCKEWISLAEELNIGWWITSALESNIGLNAIGQFAAQLGTTDFQGLGTGKLYHNNLSSPLVISNGNLWYDPQAEWDLNNLRL